MRDAQKAKVYKAEHSVRALVKDADPVLSVAQCESVLRTAAEWTAEEHPVEWCRRRARELPILSVDFPEDGKKATYWRGRQTITVPKSWARHESILLHEYAHHLTPDYAVTHGATFCDRFLTLLDNFLPECAEQLRETFDGAGVRYLPNEETKHLLAYARKVSQEARSAIDKYPVVEVGVLDTSNLATGSKLVRGHLSKATDAGVLVGDTELIERRELIALAQVERWYRP